jgi:hypothetical protein
MKLADRLNVKTKRVKEMRVKQNITSRILFPTSRRIKKISQRTTKGSPEQMKIQSDEKQSPNPLVKVTPLKQVIIDQNLRSSLDSKKSIVSQDSKHTLNLQTVY